MPDQCPIDNPAFVAAQAAQMQALANRVEHVVDLPLATSFRPGWLCPNATSVRNDLTSQRNVAHSAAQALRELAGRLERAAREAK